MAGGNGEGLGCKKKEGERKGRHSQARTETVRSLLVVSLLIMVTVSGNPETFASIFSNHHHDLQGGHY